MTPVAVTWVGHATISVDIDGYRIITDPLLTRRAAHLRRHRPPPPRDAFDADLILLSHAHLDHMHMPSLRKMSAGASVVTPRGTARLLGTKRFAAVGEIDIGERLERGPVVVEAVEAAHKHHRGPHSRIRARPLGYVIEAAGHRIYFAGDTDLYDGMAELSPITVACLPIWGWGPTIGTGHLDPERAADATRLIGPRQVVPIHWGTYAPENGRRGIPHWFNRPVAEFRAELERIGELDRLALLQPGETLLLDSA